MPQARSDLPQSGFDFETNGVSQDVGACGRMLQAEGTTARGQAGSDLPQSGFDFETNGVSQDVGACGRMLMAKGHDGQGATV